MNSKTITVQCRCGHTALALKGKHIMSVECLCRDCQQAGALLQTLDSAPPLLDDNGATRFVVYRKDRVRCQAGQDTLKEHRLSPTAKTRRVVACCCNTPMFLEFMNGHWLSLYGGLWPAQTLPALEIRTMTRDKPAGVSLPDDVPNPATHTPRFFFKLIAAWAAMGFRSPAVDYISGEIILPE